jgi:ATP-dependent RNA helicase DDX35
VQAGYCDKPGKMVGVTLPKRVSVLNIANRLAYNLNSNLGDEVGYSIRFDSNFKEDRTKIKVLTDGMLVREMLVDPLLSKYSVLMIDDCHERSLYTDIILGLLKKIRVKRKELKDPLKLVISSATIEAQLFLRYFEEPNFAAKIIEIHGRQYPVEIFYLERPCRDYVA